MTKNTLNDLNNHLFAQIERLGEEELSKTKLEFEMVRTRNITLISKEIISNARLLLDAQLNINDIPEKKELPKILRDERVSD